MGGPTTLTDWLTTYRDHGFSLVPISLSTKFPPLPEWKVYQTRHSTPEEHAHWWPDGPGHGLNLGIITGAISGDLCVLDFDSTEAWEQATHPYPNRWILKAPHVATGRGVHAYLRLDGPVRTSPFQFTGLTNHVKGEGGLVVAPPSLHQNGKTYTWSRTDVLTMAATRQQVSHFLHNIGAAKEEPDAKREQSADRFARLMAEPVPEGERHQRFAELAGYLRNVLPYDVCLEVMRLWMQQRCSSPETMEDPASQVLSIYRYQPRRPPW